MSREIRADEVHLEYTTVASDWRDEVFTLRVFHADGKEILIILDGIQVSDIVNDAKGNGIHAGMGPKHDGPPKFRRKAAPPDA